MANKRVRPAGEPEVVDVLNRTLEPEPVPELVVEDVPPLPPARPLPESELTPEQRRIRDLENQLAVERGKKDPDRELEVPTTPGAEGNILIHFLKDGFTALGQVWFRGQELEFEPHGPAYQDTCDRFGWSWLELRANEFEQVERYGDVFFRVGPWPGKSYRDAAKVPFDALKAVGSGGASVRPPTEEELEAVDRAEAKRHRAAPRLPVH